MKEIVAKICQRETLISLIVIFIGGYLLLHHHTFYQPLVAPGDHGRDLYAFAATQKGAMPFRDYWWVYGPFMPYVYALGFQVLGASLHTVLVTQVLLTILGGMLVYGILAPFVPRLMALAGAFWFLIFNADFFHTYNHVGGIVLILAVTLALTRHILSGNPRWLAVVWIGLYFLYGVKLNFGATLTAASWMVCAAGTVLFPQRKIPLKHFTYSLVFLALAVFLTYMFFLQGLKIHEVRQCLPYLSSDHPYRAHVWEPLRQWIRVIGLNILINWPNRLFALLIITGTATLAVDLKKNQNITFSRTIWIMVVGLWGITYALNLHEYLASGVIYRTYWSQPFSILMIFLVLGHLARRSSPVILYLIVATVCVIIGLRWNEQIHIVNAKAIPDQMFTSPRGGGVITGNSTRWHHTVKQTLAYLETHLEHNEMFFALPYDPLFYFLADRPSPTRQLIFFEHINIPEEQERRVIQDLKRHKVKTIVLSNRFLSGEPGLGILGKTYCPLLGKYIFDNFETVRQFGDWGPPPGWAWNYGTMILQKKPIHPDP